MKCERCGIHDATFFCKTNVNGRVSQVHLCPDCAEKLGWKTVSCVSEGAMRTIADIHK